MEKLKKSEPIIDVNNDTDNNLIFFENIFLSRISNLKGDKKCLIIGAVGKMRVGKSSALNNYYNLLTDNKDRPFSELESAETDTRGIHIKAVDWESINKKYKSQIWSIFHEEIDIIFLDCEGTESSNTVGTSRLYLISLLINSVIQIHVSKALDQGFANKLSEALVSSNKILRKLGGDIEEILPGLDILIKDTNDVSWKNAKVSDPSLEKYEDLLKKYENLMQYYEVFTKREVHIVPSPLVDENTGCHIVNNPNSIYWKTLKKIFDSTLNNKKLKTRTELNIFIKKLIKFINENDLMNIKSELHGFYEGMVDKEKCNTIKSIINKGLGGLGDIQNFSVEEIRNYFQNITAEEINSFKKSIANSSCNYIFKSFEEKIYVEIDKILSRLVEIYMTKKHEYFMEREKTKKNENVYEDVTEYIKEYQSIEKHSDFVEMYPCCGTEVISSQGCNSKTEIKTKGESPWRFVKRVFGFDSPPDVEINKNFFHRDGWGRFCRNCRKPKGSPFCRSEVKEHVNQITKTILTGINQVYTQDDWKDKKFQNDAAKFFIYVLKKFQ
jgi:hypothetical protein